MMLGFLKRKKLGLGDHTPQNTKLNTGLDTSQPTAQQKSFNKLNNVASTSPSPHQNDQASVTQPQPDEHTDLEAIKFYENQLERSKKIESVVSEEQKEMLTSLAIKNPFKGL